MRRNSRRSIPSFFAFSSESSWISASTLACCAFCGRGRNSSFEQAWEQYRLFLTYAYFVFIINASIFQTESVNTAYATRVGAAILDHDTMELLERVAASR